MKKDEWFTEINVDAGTSIGIKIQKKLHEEQTPFQNIEVYLTEKFGHLMTIDGYVMLTQRDNFIYHEMMSHPALFNHPDPAHVVIVGGGDCGTLLEVAKHTSVKKITQVEIDERVTRLSEIYFPELCASNSDPRAHFEFADAIVWMQSAASSSVDVIIVDSTDPIGPAEGLFGEAFYRQCHRVLGEQGLIVQQSESPLVHGEKIIQPMHSALRTAGFSDTRSLFFPLPTYPTGWWSATMASKSNAVALIRDQSASSLPFETRYYDFNIHLAAFQAPRFIHHLLENTT